MAFFSIITPIYNAEKQLEKCISSILSQRFTDFELILINDGSTDKSEEICNCFCKKDNRIKLINSENRGVVSARKLGGENATGRYIVSVDADDYIENDFLLKVYKGCFSEPDFVAFGYTVEKDRKCVKNCCEVGSYCGEELNRIKKAYLYDEKQPFFNGGSLIFSVWSKAIKASIYKSCVKILPERIDNGEDALLNMLILKQTESLEIIDNYSYVYTYNEGSLTNKKVSAEYVLKQKSLINSLKKLDNDSFFEQSINTFCFYYMQQVLRRVQFKNYYEFKSVMKYCYRNEMFGNTRAIPKRRLNLNERIKIFLFSYHFYYLQYMFIGFLQSHRSIGKEKK